MNLLLFICTYIGANHEKGADMEYVGTKEASAILKLSRDYISKLCREGRFPNAEQDDYGSPWRIPMKELEEYALKIRK